MDGHKHLTDQKCHANHRLSSLTSAHYSYSAKEIIKAKKKDVLFHHEQRKGRIDRAKAIKTVFEYIEFFCLNAILK